MSRPTVLYYSPAGNKKANKTKALILRLGVKLINVSEDDVDKTVEELIGSEEIKELDFGADPDEESVHASGEGPDVQLPEKISEEMIVFFNFSEDAFDRVLRELKKSHASVQLKAMVTKTNSTWPFIKLYAEISAERNYIKNNT